MFNGFKAPARRVMLPFGDTTYANLNADGLKLFDTAVKWATGDASTAPPMLNPIVRQGKNIIISWTGTGTLQQATAVTGPWSAAASQTNPKTVPIAVGALFFRIRQ